MLRWDENEKKIERDKCSKWEMWGQNFDKYKMSNLSWGVCFDKIYNLHRRRSIIL